MSEVREQQFAQEGDRPDRKQRREHLVCLLELGLEGGAAVACPQVPSDQCWRTLMQALGNLRQLEADLIA
jgi:hypothetical protein